MLETESRAAEQSRRASGQALDFETLESAPVTFRARNLVQLARKYASVVTSMEQQQGGLGAVAGLTLSQ